MSIFNRANNRIKPNADTGFSNIASGNAGRFLNRDGSFNITREGIPWLNRLSIYHVLQNLSIFTFLVCTILAILLMNVIFTGLYFLIGIEHFAGLITSTTWGRSKEIFYFSAQTFTTVGYGRINPIGDWANIVASIEAVTGFLTFAFITGMMYGRFSRPKANLVFSQVAVVAPYQGINGLMFRFVANKDTSALSDVLVKVNLGMQITENDKPVYKFYELNLERTHVESLAMNFTVVHPIDEKSPLWHFTEAEYQKADVELYVLVRAFNDVYSATVQHRTSYIYSEIKHGVKFAPMYRESEDGSTTILEMQHLNSISKVL